MRNSVLSRLLVIILVLIGLVTFRANQATFDRIRRVKNANVTVKLPIQKTLVLKLPNKTAMDPDWIDGAYEHEYDHVLTLQKNMVSLVQQNALENTTVNAVIFVLCRNSELEGILSSMGMFERILNGKYHYPYLMVNDKPFTQEFMTRVQNATASLVEFDTIPTEHWSLPLYIDTKEHDDYLTYAKEEQLYSYAGLKSYQFMCRYNSRFFYLHPKILKYRYYLRMEPNVKYDCVLPYDPFLFFSLYGIKYGYTIVANEEPRTIEGLWEATLEFMKNEGINMTDYMRELLQDEWGNYNGVHFWSNFEMGDLEFFRSPVYGRYMDAVDASKGFFMKRFGDAPVHSIAVAMLLRPNQTHFFADIGYEHDTSGVCPGHYKEFTNQCQCETRQSNMWERYATGALHTINKHFSL